MTAAPSRDQRRRLLLRGQLLLLLAAVAFVATLLGYRQLASQQGGLDRIAELLATAREQVAADRDLPGELAELEAQLAAVAAGGNPFAVVAPEPALGPDGKPLPAQAPAPAEPVDPQQALAAAITAAAGRLDSYAAWLRDEVASAEARVADQPELAAELERRRASASAIAASAGALERAAAPLADPALWRAEQTRMATLWALLAALLPLGGGALCYYLARARGYLARARGRLAGAAVEVPAARARIWRQQRDLQYNTFGSYGLHVLLIVLPFLGFHCAYDLGPPGGGGGEVGEENPVQQVQVVEVKRRKLIVNPFSPISLEKPDELEIEVEEITERLATARQAGGEGEGSGGYEGGAGAAFTFVAIDHGGRHWDEVTKTPAASKFLGYFRSRTGVRTELRPLELSIGNLRAQGDDDQQPAMIYLAFGGGRPRFSGQDIAFLRRYVQEIGGLILIDALDGSAKGQADQLVRQVMGSSAWRAIPRDDPLMTSREDLSSLDDQALALAAHAGKQVLGIRADDGYWGVVFHPGDLVDSWRGAYDRSWQETGFRFGVNVADYAMKRFTRRRR